MSRKQPALYDADGKSIFEKDDGTWIKGRAAAKVRAKYEEELAKEEEVQRRVEEALTAAKPRRGHQPGVEKSGFGTNLGDPEDTARYLAHGNYLATLPAIDWKNAKQVEKRCQEYMQSCQQYGMKPTMAQLAFACGVGRVNLSKICRGEVKSFPSDTLEVYQKYYRMVEAMLESLAQDGKINTVGFIFLAKNNYGYRDQVEHVAVTQKAEESAEKLIAEARMLGLTDGSIDDSGSTVE